MINEFEFYHGAVISRILHSSKNEIFILKINDLDNASYVLNNKTALYIKHSTKRLSPWRFSFQIEHIKQIQNLSKSYNSVFAVLVCKDDGIVALNLEQLKVLLNFENPDSSQSIALDRNKGGFYGVNGSLNSLKNKISLNNFPSVLI